MPRIDVSRLVLSAVAIMLATLVTTAGLAENCALSARDAEGRSGIPAGLLSAIGKVESGESGGWNWTVNPNSLEPGRRFGDADAARRYVQDLMASGDQMIDIGCFQIDLLYHPGIFRNWQDGFDATSNADAAASILSGLYSRTNDWNQAVALYHSADPARGASYLRSVLAAWHGGSFAPDMSDHAQSDPYTILSQGFVSGLTIWTPAGAQAAPRRRLASMARLPRVVLP